MAGSVVANCVICEKTFRHPPSKHRRYCGIACYRVAQRSGHYRPGPKPTTHREPCAHCGKEVFGVRARKRTGEEADRKFCDRACYDAFRVKVTQSREMSCHHCGARFIPNWKGRKYCSMDCRKVALKAKPKRCVNCKTLFTPVAWVKKTGRFISLSSGRTCSRECHLAWIRNNEERKRKIGDAFRGHRHPNWQGGKSRLNDINNRGSGWPKARERALKRDGYRCVDCGITEDECRERYGRGLDVDHIVPFHNWPNSRSANKLSNLASRCASCHRKEEATRNGVQMVLPYGDSEKRRHKGYARGATHPKAKLTEGDVLAILDAAKSGASGADLARQYGVQRTTIYSILKGKIWRHLLRDPVAYEPKWAAGSRSSNAKMDEAKVVDIRRRVANGESMAAVARDVGMSYPGLCSIIYRKTWNHVP